MSTIELRNKEDLMNCIEAWAKLLGAKFDLMQLSNRLMEVPGTAEAILRLEDTLQMLDQLGTVFKDAIDAYSTDHMTVTEGVPGESL